MCVRVRVRVCVCVCVCVGCTYVFKNLPNSKAEASASPLIPRNCCLHKPVHSPLLHTSPACVRLTAYARVRAPRDGAQSHAGGSAPPLSLSLSLSPHTHTHTHTHTLAPTPNPQGSVERMFAILTEHFAGNWPLWLSPRYCGRLSPSLSPSLSF